MPNDMRDSFGPVDVVERAIRLQILRGGLAPGDRLLPERELCQKYLVSRGTLRKALARIAAEGMLRKEGRGGTLVAQAPAHAESRRAATRTVLFGGVFRWADPDMLAEHPWLSEMYKGAEDGVLAGGWNIAIQLGDALRRHVAVLRDERVARPSGIILVGHEGEALAEEFELLGVPSVLVDYPPASGLFDSVLPDNYGSGQMAADYLLRLGHRRLGTVAPRYDGRQTPPVGIRDRLLGWSDALASRGVPADPALQRVVDIGHDGRLCDGSACDLRELLRAPSRPTAIFVPAHIPAVELHQACLEAGLRVPQDISLVVFDHVPATFSPAVKFTTCHVDRAMMGKVAWECIRSRIESGNHVVMKRILPARLVEGQTTQRPDLTAGA